MIWDSPAVMKLKRDELPPTTDSLAVSSTTTVSGRVMSLFFPSKESVALNFVSAKVGFDCGISEITTLHWTRSLILCFMAFYMFLRDTVYFV